MKNMTKRFAKLFAVTLSVLMLLGAVSVSADASVINTDYEGSDEDILVMPEEPVIAPAPAFVYLTLEGPENPICIETAICAADGSVTAGDVIAELLADHEVVGLDVGYISSIDGLEAGMCGGWDGWLYAVKYFEMDENGELVLYIDIPNVGVNDYPITSSCNIVLYYADYGVPFAGSTFDENGMIRLVTYTPVYDENYNVVSFTEAPLANGEFTFTAFTVDENGETVLGETYVFTADENGVTKLHGDLRELPNGDYMGSVGKQSATAVTVGETDINMPEVVRYSDYYTVDVHPTKEEIFKEKVALLLLGM